MWTVTKFLRTAAVVVATLAFSTSGASAQGTEAKRDTAKKLFRAGTQAYASGQYMVAAQAYEKAYETLPLAAIAFSTAQAHRLQYFIDKKPGRLKRAVELYRTYLKQVSKGGRRDDAAASLAELEPILQRLEALSSTGIQAVRAAQPITQLMVNTQIRGARAFIDGHEGEVPLIRKVKPGAHAIRVVAKGYFPVEKTATAVDGQLIPIEVTLRPVPAQVTITTEAGASVAVDGRPVGTTPFSRPLQIPAGKHFITVTRRGRRAWMRELSLARGQTLTVKAPLTSTTQRKVARWVFAASAATFVAAGVTGFLAFRADGDADDLNKKREASGLTSAELDRYYGARDRRDSRLGTTYVLLGVGGALGVAGLLTYVFDMPRAEAPPLPSAVPSTPTQERRTPFAVTPVVGAGMAGMSVMGRF